MLDKLIDEYFKTIATVYESSYNILRNLNPWDKLSEDEQEEFLKTLAEITYDGIEFSGDFFKDSFKLFYTVDPED